ncbi:MAG: hypothetical protein JNL98_20865 [Bryobacterales bacterium]|nr:hypothetical protein [Bryobacterales bacterium]
MGVLITSGDLCAAPFTLHAVIISNTPLPDGTRLAPFSLYGLSNNGTVLVTGASTVSAFASAYTQFGRVIGTGDVVGGIEIQNVLSAAINNSDQVLINAQRASGGYGIFSSSAQLLGTGQAVGGSTISHFPEERLGWNDSGEAAVSSVLTSGAGIVTTTGISIVLGDILGGIQIQAVGPVSLADNGRVAFVGNAGFSGVFDQNGLVYGPGRNIGGRTIQSYDGRPDINNAGEIAVTGIFPGGNGVYTSNRIVGESGQVLGGRQLTGVALRPDINAVNQVAYLGFYSGGEAVYLDSQLVADRGFLVDGRTILSIDQEPLVNDLGQVAFRASLDDGSMAIILATPDVQVPEPATWELTLGIGLVLLARKATDYFA